MEDSNLHVYWFLGFFPPSIPRLLQLCTRFFPKNPTLHVYFNLLVYWLCNLCTHFTFVPTSSAIGGMRVPRLYLLFFFRFFSFSSLNLCQKSKVFLKAITYIEFKVFDDMKSEFWYPLSEEWTKGQKVLEANYYVFISNKKRTKYFRSFFGGNENIINLLLKFNNL